MIRALRHISIRLCISALIWMPVSFILLTSFGYIIHGKNFIAAAVILFIIFFTVGFLMDQIGKNLIYKLIKEAKSWEQAGIYKKSEKLYIKAVRIYDSFLLYPWRNRKLSETLTGCLAKFSLACSIRNPIFDSAVTSFLSMSPNNADIALLWLERLCSSAPADPDINRHETELNLTGHLLVNGEIEPINRVSISDKEKEILTDLAEIHTGNPDFVVLIADLFTKLNRCDFTARKIYKKALNMPDLKQTTREAIKQCLGAEDKKLSSFAVSKRISSFETDNLQNKKAGKALKSTISMQKITADSVFNLIHGIHCRAKKVFKQIFIMTLSSLKSFFNAISTIITFIKKREKLKFIVKWGISAIICMGIIIFMVNTFSRLFSEKKPEFQENQAFKENIHKTEPAQKKLFTIQVAAYLKKKYGDAYVAKLKAKGLDAYLSRTEGGGKTWFIVRISKFPDKKTASQYGKKLKQQGYIDDFFVDNTSRRH